MRPKSSSAEVQNSSGALVSSNNVKAPRSNGRLPRISAKVRNSSVAPPNSSSDKPTGVATARETIDPRPPILPPPSSPEAKSAFLRLRQIGRMARSKVVMSSSIRPCLRSRSASSSICPSKRMMPICAKATPAPDRAVCRRFSELSCITAPAR